MTDNREKLSSDFCDDTFRQFIEETLKDNNSSVSEQDMVALIQKTKTNYMTNIRDKICTLDRQQVSDAYALFIEIINSSGSNFSAIPDDKSLTSIAKYVSDVPELQQILQLVKIYKTYDKISRNLGSVDFHPSQLNALQSKIMRLPLSEEERKLLLNGYSKLLQQYAAPHTPTNNISPSFDVDPLPENYLEQCYNNQEQAETDINNMIDGFCTLDPNIFNEEFDHFLHIINLHETWQQIPEGDGYKTIETRIENIPPLKLVYQTIQVSEDYSSLQAHDASTPLFSKDVTDFRKNYLYLAGVISPAAFADLEYGTVKLYEDCKDTEKQSDIAPLYYNVICDSNDIEAIADSFQQLQYSRAYNDVTAKSCKRILKDYKDELSNHELYLIYKTLGDTHRRTINKIGFISPAKSDKMELHNLQAAGYYQKAFRFAATPEEKITMVRGIRSTSEKIYLEKYAKRYPPHTLETPSLPYGGYSNKTR